MDISVSSYFVLGSAAVRLPLNSQPGEPGSQFMSVLYPSTCSALETLRTRAEYTATVDIAHRVME